MYAVAKRSRKVSKCASLVWQRYSVPIRCLLLTIERMIELLLRPSREMEFDTYIKRPFYIGNSRIIEQNGRESMGIFYICMLFMAFYSFVMGIPLIYEREDLKWIFFHAALCLIESCLVAFWFRALMACF